MLTPPHVAGLLDNFPSEHARVHRVGKSVGFDLSDTPASSVHGSTAGFATTFGGDSDSDNGSDGVGLEGGSSSEDEFMPPPSTVPTAAGSDSDSDSAADAKPSTKDTSPRRNSRLSGAGKSTSRRSSATSATSSTGKTDADDASASQSGSDGSGRGSETDSSSSSTEASSSDLSEDVSWRQRPCMPAGLQHSPDHTCVLATTTGLP